MDGPTDLVPARKCVREITALSHILRLPAEHYMELPVLMEQFLYIQRITDSPWDRPYG